MGSVQTAARLVLRQLLECCQAAGKLLQLLLKERLADCCQTAPSRLLLRPRPLPHFCSVAARLLLNRRWAAARSATPQANCVILPLNFAVLLGAGVSKATF